MRQSSCVVLLVLTVTGFMGGMSRAEFALAPTAISPNAEETRLAQASGVSQRGIGNSLLTAQNMPQTKADKDKDKDKDKPATHTSERTEIYQCVEYCAVVRQSCEGLATIQPDAKIARIGSKENSKWSRECQNIYDGCRYKCTINDSSIQWKRLKEKKDKEK